MIKSQLLKALTSGAGCAALLLMGMSIVPSSSRADNDNNAAQDEKAMIETGLSIASANGIQLNMDKKDRDMVGLGSYLVNVVGDCNGCHSNGPSREWCCDTNPVSANSDGTGNPYLLSPP